MRAPKDHPTQKKLWVPLGLALALFGMAAPAYAEEKLSAKTFAGADGKLNKEQAAFYLIHRDKEPVSKFMAPGEMTLDRKKVMAAMGRKVDDLRSKTRHESPWTWEELDALAKKSGTKKSDQSAWKEIEGITKVKELGDRKTHGSLGPFRLRKSAADLSEKEVTKAKGATLGFSSNRLSAGSGAWNSEGILNYPIGFGHEGGATTGRSITMELGPAVEWKLAQIQGKPSQGVEDLAFSMPTTIYVTSGSESRALWLIQGRPYYQTDFSGGYEIYGAELSTEYVGAVFGWSSLSLGSFRDIPHSHFQYQVRLIPKLDYSETERVDVHTTRKIGDDWLRMGGMASFDLRYGGLGLNPLQTGASYQFLKTVRGSGDFSYLFKAYATWWLTQNTGLTLEYSKGDTPVANKPIDLVTLGLEFKY